MNELIYNSLLFCRKSLQVVEWMQIGFLLRFRSDWSGHLWSDSRIRCWGSNHPCKATIEPPCVAIASTRWVFKTQRFRKRWHLEWRPWNSKLTRAITGVYAFLPWPSHHSWSPQTQPSFRPPALVCSWFWLSELLSQPVSRFLEWHASTGNLPALNKNGWSHPWLGLPLSLWLAAFGLLWPQSGSRIPGKLCFKSWRGLVLDGAWCAPRYRVPYFIFLTVLLIAPGANWMRCQCFGSLQLAAGGEQWPFPAVARDLLTSYSTRGCRLVPSIAILFSDSFWCIRSFFW